MMNSPQATIAYTSLAARHSTLANVSRCLALTNILLLLLFISIICEPATPATREVLEVVPALVRLKLN